MARVGKRYNKWRHRCSSTRQLQLRIISAWWRMPGAFNVCGRNIAHWRTYSARRRSNLRLHPNGVSAFRKTANSEPSENMSYFNQSDVILSAGDVTTNALPSNSSDVGTLADNNLTTASRDGLMGWSPPPGDYTFHGLYLHPHWLRHRELIEAAPRGFLYAVGVYMTAICFAGIVGNLTVIVVFLRLVNHCCDLYWEVNVPS